MSGTTVNAHGEPNAFEQVGVTLIGTAGVNPVDSIDLVEMAEIADSGDFDPGQDDSQLSADRFDTLRVALSEGQTITAVLLGQVVEIKRLPIEF
jgi:hypothetical protein